MHISASMYKLVCVLLVHRMYTCMYVYIACTSLCVHACMCTMLVHEYSYMSVCNKIQFLILLVKNVPAVGIVLEAGKRRLENN